ncbi:hypothetical protein B0H13DRAFT_2053340 [Mycena leptocephala]|nr:hypothetical protein B0H13DRAFT_2053340 [Mycena leptocephala]
MRRTQGIPSAGNPRCSTPSSALAPAPSFLLSGGAHCHLRACVARSLSRSSTHAAAGEEGARRSTGDRTLGPGGGRRKSQAEGRRACIGDKSKTESGGEGYVGRGATKRREGLGRKADSGGTYVRIRRERQGTMCCDAVGHVGKPGGDKNWRRE